MVNMTNMAKAWIDDVAEDSDDAQIAADKKAALTKLKNREEVPNNVCANNPIAAQFQLGQQLGVSGTPAMIFENGQMVPGFVEPERLAQMLNIKS